ncbi:hypothetical protein BBP40_005407 [Aspergillus hancockii]|nr:hypothetical protein BBP40_005407 [Aspergillus hancockii]
MASFKEAFTLSKETLSRAKPYGSIQLILQALVTAIYIGHIRPQQDGRLPRYPQPSSDPMDLLNWPFKRKLASLICMSIFGFTTNFASASIASAFPLLAIPLAFNPPVPMSKLTRLYLWDNCINRSFVRRFSFTADFVEGQCAYARRGKSSMRPLANTFGRRPVILLSALLHIIFPIWAARSKSFNSLLAARLLMGFAGAPADTVAPNMVDEIYYTSQRGQAMGLYTILAAGPLIGGLSCTAASLLLSFFSNRKPFSVKSDQNGGAADHPTDPEKLAPSQEFENFSASQGSTRLEVSFEMGYSVQDLERSLFSTFLALRLPGVWLVILWYAALVPGVVAVSTVGPSNVTMPTEPNQTYKGISV